MKVEQHTSDPVTNVDAWMHPSPGDLAASYAILDDRERLYSEHRLTA
jgi:hypothetical protein